MNLFAASCSEGAADFVSVYGETIKWDSKGEVPLF